MPPPIDGGPVTGGLLVLGLARGRTETEQSEEPAFTAAKTLHDRFLGQYKVICCRGLTRRLPWGEPEHHQACQAYVRFAATTVQDLLDDAPRPPQEMQPVIPDDGVLPPACAACPDGG